MPDFGGDDIGTAILVALAAVVFVFVVVPLLLFGLELGLLGVAIASGAFARTLLGRPWVVQARRIDSSDEPLSWQAAGWRSSGRLIDEVAGALEAGRPPAPIEGSELHQE